jgi:hypothetical protein
MATAATVSGTTASAWSNESRYQGEEREPPRMKYSLAECKGKSSIPPIRPSPSYQATINPLNAND